MSDLTRTPEQREALRRAELEQSASVEFETSGPQLRITICIGSSFLMRMGMIKRAMLGIGLENMNTALGQPPGVSDRLREYVGLDD